MKQSVAALVMFLTVGLGAQEQFEVASVKQVRNNEGILTINFAPERFEALMLLRDIVATAYDVRDFQLIGGPGWVRSDYFQILARTPGKASNAEVRRMWPSRNRAAANYGAGRQNVAARRPSGDFRRAARDR